MTSKGYDLQQRRDDDSIGCSVAFMTQVEFSDLLVSKRTHWNLAVDCQLQQRVVRLGSQHDTHLAVRERER
jgi:hypothetical protein